MKIHVFLALLLLLSGCRKTVEERIIDSASEVQESRLNEFHYQNWFNQYIYSVTYPKIQYDRSIRLFNVNVHYFNLYKSVLLRAKPGTAIAIEDQNKNIIILKKRKDIIKYMRPFKLYEFQGDYRYDFFSRNSNWLLTQIIEFIQLMNRDDNDISVDETLLLSADNITDLSRDDRKRLLEVNFHPLTKVLLNTSIEVSFFTWDYYNRTLSEHKLILSDKVVWEKKVILRNFGPKQKYHMYN